MIRWFRPVARAFLLLLFFGLELQETLKNRSLGLGFLKFQVVLDYYCSLLQHEAIS
ncbi:MAG: hypothetical protein HYU64_13480, partial [Armatimonadetes bacterium]|nr:hypothetical protein [Armatimonadota bacterium]